MRAGRRAIDPLVLRRALRELRLVSDTGERELTEHERTVIFERSVRVTCRLASLAEVAHAASIVVVGMWFIPASMTAFRPAWTVSSLVLLVSAVRCWLPRSVDEYRPTRRDLWFMRAEPIAWSLLYGALSWHVLPEVSAGHQMWIVANLAGVIGAGAMSLSTERSVGFTWLWGNVATTLTVFAAFGSATYLVLGAQLVVYAFALTIVIASIAAAFERRCLAELDAEAGRALVGLLLDDFEGGARDWLWRTDASGGLRDSSSRFESAAGRAAGEIDGRPLVELLHELGADTWEGGEAIERIERSMAERAAFRDVEVPLVIEGELRWWSVSGRPAAADGEPAWHGVCADVTRDHEHQREVLRLATVDALTGLANRHRFNQVLGERVERRQPETEIVLGIIDLDDFKEINDTLGHPLGDRVLAEVARRLRSVMGPDDLCARLGGDEFAILLSAPARSAAAVQAWSARRLRAFLGVLRQPMHLDGLRLEVRGSIGFAGLPGDAASGDDLIRLADLALYSAKAAGRDTVRPYEPQLSADALVRARAVQDLGRAVEAEQLVVWFQPQYDLGANRLVGAEALVRWRHPTQGLLAPVAFIPTAESSGLIVPLGKQVLRAALAAARSWPDDLRVSVNVSPTSLMASGFAAMVEREVERSGVDPHRLELEITESGVVDPEAVAVLERVRRHGVRVAIDDFGTGYSSFATLRRLPVDALKIDRAFVTPLVPEADDTAQVIVRSIIDVASALQLEVVAEGVETETQAEILRTLDCGLVQGYLFSRPVPADEMAALAWAPAARRS